MAIDVTLPAVESSPAAAPVEPVTPAAAPEQRTLKSLNSAEHTEWRKTGKMPEAKPTTEDSATSQESSDADGEEAAGESAPASEAGKEAQGNKNQRRSNAGDRVKELLADKKRLETELAEARKGKTENKAAESSTAAAPETVKSLEAPKKPDFKDFTGKTAEEYEAAYDKYVEDLTDYKAKKAIADHQQEQATKAANDKLMVEIAEAKTRYADFEDVIPRTVAAFTTDKAIPPAVVQMANSSDNFPDLMYALGQKPDELAKFIQAAKTNPAKAIRLIVEMDNLVAAELKKGKGAAPAKGSEVAATDRNDKGQFVPKSETPVKTVTDRGKPPAEVGGTGSAPADETVDALKRGSFADFQARQNAKDLAKSK